MHFASLPQLFAFSYLSVDRDLLAAFFLLKIYAITDAYNMQSLIMYLKLLHMHRLEAADTVSSASLLGHEDAKDSSDSPRHPP